MKKYFFIALISLLLSSCGNDDSYRISGKYPGAENGTMVYIALMDEMFTDVDSAVVQNERFEFAGRQDTAAMRMLFSSVPLVGGPFVLENGDIDIRINNRGMLRGGTSLNDDLQQYLTDKERVSYEPTLEFLAENRNGIGKEQADSLRMEIDAARARFGNTMAHLISKNIDNCLGAFLILQSENFLNAQSLNLLMDSVPDKFRDKRFNMTHAKVKAEIERLNRAAATAVGAKYVNFELPDDSGCMVLFSDIVERSKYTLLDFWASWCIPCRQELPEIKSIYRDFAKHGVSLVSVSLDDDSDCWKDAVNELAMDWCQLCDPAGGSMELAAAYGVNTIPNYVLVDSEGTIVLRSLRASDMVLKLREIFRQ